jgi:hypothetical protein
MRIIKNIKIYYAIKRVYHKSVAKMSCACLANLKGAYGYLYPYDYINVHYTQIL